MGNPRADMLGIRPEREHRIRTRIETMDLEAHQKNLLAALDLEHAEEQRRHREARDGLTVAERIARGVALGGLDLREESWGLGDRLLLDYRVSGDIPDEFRSGAVVELRLREGGDGARGVVSRAWSDGVQVAFDRPPAEALLQGGAILELCPNDFTHRRSRQALELLGDLGSGEVRRKREVWAGVAPPRPGQRRPVAHATLNDEQREAAERALGAEDLFLVHGPPGTGKSTVLIAVAAAAVRERRSVLATAASNAAVDHLLESALAAGLRAVRIGHPARVLPRLQEHTLDLMVRAHPARELADRLRDEAFASFGYARRQRARGRSKERFSQAHAATREARVLLKEARTYDAQAVQAILKDAEILCATCAALATPPLAGLAFDLVIFDEATQANEPISWLALPRAQTLVMAGDHQQLPPTVLSPEASARGLSRSLFERLMEVHGAVAAVMLRRQYRMHASIMRWSSERFYEGALVADDVAATRTLAELLRDDAAIDAPPVLFLDTAGAGADEEQEPQSDSYHNPTEARLLTARVQELVAAGLEARAIGVIAPYQAQVQHLRRALREAGVDTEIEVASVDAFQGREKEAILLSLTRSNAHGEVGFLADLRRMNVAMTRARRHLFMVGDSGTLAALPFYAALVEYTQAIGGYRSVWEWPGAR